MTGLTHVMIPQQVVRRQIVLNPREETMKIRLVVALVGLAIGFTLPSLCPTKRHGRSTNSPAV